MQQKNTANKKIFISYRVHDTAGETGRLVDALKQHFSDDQIFMDIENLEPGADFTEAIERSLSTCDVFLAVIGPRWLGEREGEPRINNPNDWVRLEVGTALRRNVRVVPVLVDGGALPTTEQLPEDLQPLLRRQSIEISNKRWRYDTDQLINFLVNTVGIPPKRAPLQTAALPPAKTTNKKTWVYIVAGFVLCFLVLAVVGSLMQDPKKAGDAPSTTAAQNTVPGNTGTASGQSSSPATASGETNNTENITGTWEEVDEGQTSTLILSQNGSQVSVQVQTEGQMVGAGTGEVNGRNVELAFPLFGMATALHLVRSDDGSTLSGTYVIQATGVTQPIKLVRKN